MFLSRATRFSFEVTTDGALVRVVLSNAVLLQTRGAESCA